MSRNAFPKVECDLAEAAGMREHAKMERASGISWTQNADSIDRLRRALAQIAAGTVPHREGNTTAEDCREFAADALGAKQ